MRTIQRYTNTFLFDLALPAAALAAMVIVGILTTWGL